MDGWMDKWMRDGWMDGWVNGWMNEWMRDGCRYSQVQRADRQTHRRLTRVVNTFNLLSSFQTSRLLSSSVYYSAGPFLFKKKKRGKNRE